MFKVAIISSPLVGDLAESIMGRIEGESFRGDVSTLASLRAFFNKRIESDGIHLRFGDSYCSEQDVNGADDEALVSMVMGKFSVNVTGMGNTIYIHSLTSDKDTNSTIVDALRKEFVGRYAGYKEFAGVEAMYKNNFPLFCAYNEEKKNVVLVVSGLTYKKLHFLQAALLPMFPWYYKKGDGSLSDLEKELINTLTKDDADAYTACIQKIADTYDFRAEKIRKSLAGFETQFEKAALTAAKNSLDSIDRTIDNFHSQIEIQLKERNSTLVRILGLEEKIARGCEGESEIMEYFLCNKKLNMISVNGSKLNFIVAGTLSYFDAEGATLMLNRHSDSFYAEGEGIAKLLKAIIVDESVKLRVCAMFTLDLNASVSANAGVNYANYGFTTYLPNPHLQHYQCLGSAERTINDCIRHRDYIGAIEQCIVSCSNLNVGDPTVMHRTMEDLDDSDIKCIELPDGSIVTPKEAIDWLNRGNDGEKKEEE